MSTVDLASIKDLRTRTNAPMMACKQALVDGDGDMDKAIELLRKRGAIKAADKASRSTCEGCVSISGRALVVLRCETDFVARNDHFQSLADRLAATADQDGQEAAENLFAQNQSDLTQEVGENITLGDIKIITGGDVVAGYVHSNYKIAAVVALKNGDEQQARDVSMHVTAMKPEVVSPEQVPAEMIAKETEIYREQLKKEGKPEEIIEKIMTGKLKKFCNEQALSTQSFVKNPEQTISEYLGQATVVDFACGEV